MPTIPPDIAPWWYYTAMCSAVLIIGIAKSGFGGGLGILAIPLVANTLPPDRALAVLLPILIAADVVAAWQHRGGASARWLKPTIGGAVIGIGLGFMAVRWLESQGGDQESLARSLKLVVGVVCLLVLALQVVRMILPRLPRLPASQPWTIGIGVVCGVVSMLSHSAGPILTAYMLEQQLPKRVLVSTLVIFFLAANLIKVPLFFSLGWITGPRMTEAMLFCLLVPVGSLVGLWMHRTIPQKPFAFIIYAAAAVGGIRLIATA